MIVGGIIFLIMMFFVTVMIYKSPFFNLQKILLILLICCGGVLSCFLWLASRVHLLNFMFVAAVMVTSHLYALYTRFLGQIEILDVEDDYEHSTFLYGQTILNLWIDLKRLSDKSRVKTQ